MYCDLHSFHRNFNPAIHPHPIEEWGIPLIEVKYLSTNRFFRWLIFSHTGQICSLIKLLKRDYNTDLP